MNSSEIYSSSNTLWGNEGIYLSNNDYPDDHPEIYFGELKSLDPGGGRTLWVYCIWQAHINGKTALAMSKNIATFTTSIPERHDIDQFIKVAPNPFHDKLNISVNTNGRKSELAIFSASGKQIAGFTPSASSGDWQTFYGHPLSKIADGVYFIVFTNGDARYEKKVVFSY